MTMVSLQATMQHKNMYANPGNEILFGTLRTKLKNQSNRYKLPNRHHSLLTQFFQHLPLVSCKHIEPVR